MKLFLPSLLSLSIAISAQACLWDTDTLAMERARFPEASEIIVGKFPRHSREFYEWRKARTQAELAKDPNQAALYDDLAVALHKLGDHRGAIEVMQAKELVAPGQYETYSNLGTFYIYTGELDKALEWIQKALTLNPDAHFGREKYQKWLVEWLKEGKPHGPEVIADESVIPVGFAHFIMTRSGQKVWSEQLRKPALTGLLGMMRFADYDNPLLLEALGDVLSAGEFRGNASKLAAQAYELASRQSQNDVEKQRLRKKGGPAEALDAGLTQGAKLMKKVRTDELEWIKSGKDANAEFQKKYFFQEQLKVNQPRRGQAAK